MLIVYAFFTRRRLVRNRETGSMEAAEVVDAVWAHTIPEDRLEHVSGHVPANRVDLLLFLLPPGDLDHDPDSAQRRAAALLHRSHLGSPCLQHRYLPPSLAPPHPYTPGTRRSF